MSVGFFKEISQDYFRVFGFFDDFSGLFQDSLRFFGNFPDSLEIFLRFFEVLMDLLRDLMRVLWVQYFLRFFKIIFEYLDVLVIFRDYFMGFLGYFWVKLWTIDDLGMNELKRIPWDSLGFFEIFREF